jgi:hypothetical protein
MNNKDLPLKYATLTLDSATMNNEPLQQMIQSALSTVEECLKVRRICVEARTTR